MAPCRRIGNLIISFAIAVSFLCSCLILTTGKGEVKTEKERDAELRYKWTHPDNDFDLPLIFIGGVPRSGTTLMRSMLESHPDIRCGPETHVIPELMIKRRTWLKSAGELHRLQEAGVQPNALNIAMGRFILEIIKKHAPPALYYCNKDPFVLSDSKYVHQLFPNAKFLLMIRDGRASAHSVVSRNVVITNVNYTSHRDVLRLWNDTIALMHRQCKELGDKICLPVYYEQLVLQPINNTRRIFNFLDIPWNKDVLHHEHHVNDTTLSSFEPSTDQVKKPLYLDALTSWFGHIPPDVERDMAKIAPMLAVLGYDPDDPTPKYGEPDQFVLGKSKY